MNALCKEATFINQAFSQQVLSKGNELTFKNPHPFQGENETPAAVGYRYNRWNLTEDLVLVGRCEIDAVMVGKDKKNVYTTVKALNEHDSRSEWRKKIDNQRAAVLATELRPNANKLSKWGCQATLAGAEAVRLGFVSRVSPKDTFNHVILAVQDYSTKEFITQINLNIKNSWAVLKHIIALINKQPAGKYILMRNPDKPMLHLYAVPEADSENGKEEVK
jgi:translation initiation factor 3 subunit D